MPSLTKAKLNRWHRRAVLLDRRAKKLMDDMMFILGSDDETTDQIDNVTHATEELCDVLARPDLDMWKIDC